MTLCILNVDTRWGEFSSLRAGGRPSVITEYVAGWASEPVQSTWLPENLDTPLLRIWNMLVESGFVIPRAKCG
jgi:hypothetical protein